MASGGREIVASQRDRLEFVAIVVSELCGVPGMEGFDVSGPLELARFLLRAEATLHRLAEEGCNRALTTQETIREGRLMARVREACAARGIDVTFNGDPRGSSIYLKLPSGRANDWGGRGWGVP